MMVNDGPGMGTFVDDVEFDCWMRQLLLRMLGCSWCTRHCSLLLYDVELVMSRLEDRCNYLKIKNKNNQEALFFKQKKITIYETSKGGSKNSANIPGTIF